MAKRRKHFGASIKQHESDLVGMARQSIRHSKRAANFIAADKCKTALFHLREAIYYAGEANGELIGAEPKRHTKRTTRARNIETRARMAMHRVGERFTLSCLRNHA